MDPKEPARRCEKCGKVMSPDDAAHDWQPCTDCFFSMTPGEQDDWLAPPPTPHPTAPTGKETPDGLR